MSNQNNNQFTHHFQYVKSESEARKIYRMLAFKYHPDHGGSDEDMKAVNAAYHEALKRIDGTKTTYTDNAGHERQSTYHYNEEMEEELIAKLSELLTLKATKIPTLKIMLIGSWIWLDGTEREHKDLLNKNGAKCLWHQDKGLWYWRPSSEKNYRGRGKGDFVSMALKYGYSEIREKEKTKIAA